MAGLEYHLFLHKQFKSMKKIICIVLSMTMACSALFAQNADKKDKAPAKKADAPKKEAPAKKADAPKKEAPAAADKPAADKGGKMKKDGTPDKRFKENKEAKPAAGPTKKDGTPDMRYKANKDAAKKDAPAKK
jgi:hypothetical protein